MRAPLHLRRRTLALATVALISSAVGVVPASRAVAASSVAHEAATPMLIGGTTGPTTSSTSSAAPSTTSAPTTAATTTTTAPISATFVACPPDVTEVTWPPGWRVECHGPRAGLLGLTQPSGITSLYVRAGASLPLRVAALHEAGHTWDLARLDQTGITTWCAARGCDPLRFFAGGENDEGGWSEPGGAEDWAAAWNACHGGAYHRSYLGLAAPGPDLCALQDTLTGYPD